MLLDEFLQSELLQMDIEEQPAKFKQTKLKCGCKRIIYYYWESWDGRGQYHENVLQRLCVKHKKEIQEISDKLAVWEEKRKQFQAEFDLNTTHLYAQRLQIPVWYSPDAETIEREGLNEHEETT